MPRMIESTFAPVEAPPISNWPLDTPVIAPIEPRPLAMSTSMPRFFQKPSWRAM